MRRSLFLGTFFVFFFLLNALSSLQANWIIYFGAPICTAVNNQVEPTIVSDGAGGAIIAWSDARDMSQEDIYAQRIDGNGDTLWAWDGVPVIEDPNDQILPVIASDGSRGAIIVWDDTRNGALDLYGQRLDSSGAPAWPAAGVSVCGAAYTQKDPAIIPDGAGGAIVAWVDSRSGVSFDIYAQRLNREGAALWGVNGVAVCTAAGSQINVVIAADDAEGAIIAWEDRRAGALVPRIFAQRVNSGGGVAWMADGVAVCPASPYMANPAIVRDGAGGAIVAWENIWSGTTSYILAQRISASGGLGWGACGLTVCSDATGQGYPVMASDGAGGAFIAWIDLRGGETEPDIYAQRLSGSGDFLWQPAGNAVCAAGGEQSYPAIAASRGGCVVAWQDFRSFNAFDIYAQKLDSGGTARWQENGFPVCLAIDFQEAPVVADDGSGGGIVAWQDFRSRFDYSIYALRVNTNGAVTGAEEHDAPRSAFLSQNFPNPFNPATRIVFELGAASRVSLRIFDASGALIRTLIDERRSAGRHESAWDGTDSSGRAVASGVYFYRLDTGSFTRTKKMVLVR